MNKIGVLLLFCCISLKQVFAQVLPKEGSALNYRLIGFSFPVAEKKNNCVIEIAPGNYYNEDSFEKNKINTLVCRTNRMIAKVPFWGKEYTWCVVCCDKGQKPYRGALHHFSTLLVPGLDTVSRRLRVTQAARKYKDAFVMSDKFKVMYDMGGDAIWFLPQKTDLSDTLYEIRDLKLSPQASITFIHEGGIFEVNYNGNILWQGPNTGEISGSKSENFHHEFTRLQNGNYMALGIERPERKPKQNETPAADDKLFHTTLPLPTLIEYDSKGRLLWFWKSANYFRHSDLVYYTRSGPVGVDVHSNSFYFDEENKAIYISCKDISRIIKIKYPEGTVMNVYGEVFKKGVQPKGNGLFCDQHSVRRSKNGYLYLYNNNPCDTGSYARVMEMLEAPAGKKGLKKIWEYECRPGGSYTPKEAAGGGGNVMELPDRSLFVSTGGPYCKIFIVNRNKEILWEAVPEIYSANEKKWEATSQYRSSIVVDPKMIEKLIWAGEEEQ